MSSQTLSPFTENCPGAGQMNAVRIPSVMRVATAGAKHVQVGGSTVGEVIRGLVRAYPALGSQLLSADGRLLGCLNVYLNDTDIRHLDALETPVGGRDSLVLLAAMAGA